MEHAVDSVVPIIGASDFTKKLIFLAWQELLKSGCEETYFILVEHPTLETLLQLQLNLAYLVILHYFLAKDKKNLHLNFLSFLLVSIHGIIVEYQNDDRLKN